MNRAVGRVTSAVGLAGVSVLAPAAGGLVSAAVDDSARVGAVVDAFNDRMRSAGWESLGPSDGELGSGNGDGDVVLTNCMGGDPLFDVFEQAVGFPGETVRRHSDEFARDGGAATEEQILGLAVAVDEPNQLAIDEILEVMGSKLAAACIRADMEADVAADNLPSGVTPEVAATTWFDVGVGHRSAVIELSLALEIGEFTLASLDAVFALAHVGRDVVGVIYFADADGDFDPEFDAIAELALLADSVAG